jgi:peroxiredoxin
LKSRSPTQWLIATLLALGAAAGASAAGGNSLSGKPAPDFVLRSIGGPNVRLSEQLGDVVVIAFWSSRCGPCRAHLKELSALQAGLKGQGLTVYGVNVDDDMRAAREYAASLSLGFAMLLDPAKGVARAYRVDSLPMMVTIDRLGMVRGIRRDDRAGAPSNAGPELRRLLAQ